MPLLIREEYYYSIEEVEGIAIAFTKWILQEKGLTRTWLGEPMWTDMRGNRYKTSDLMKEFIAIKKHARH